MQAAIERVETAVLGNYATITLPAELRARITSRMDDVLTSSASETADLRTRVTARLATLDAQEDRLIDLIGDPDWPQDKIATRLRTIGDERDRLARQLDDTETPKLEAAHQILAYLVDLLADPRELYRRTDNRTRAVLNKAFFTKIYLDVDEYGPYVSRDELTDLVEPLVDAARSPHSDRGPLAEGCSNRALTSVFHQQKILVVGSAC